MMDAPPSLRAPSYGKILLPHPDNLPNMIKTHEPIDIQTFISEPAIITFDIGVIDRFS
jgi:hypothetical protein